MHSFFVKASNPECFLPLHRLLYLDRLSSSWLLWEWSPCTSGLAQLASWEVIIDVFGFSILASIPGSRVERNPSLSRVLALSYNRQAVLLVASHEIRLIER